MAPTWTLDPSSNSWPARRRSGADRHDQLVADPEGVAHAIEAIGGPLTPVAHAPGPVASGGHRVWSLLRGLGLGRTPARSAEEETTCQFVLFGQRPRHGSEDPYQFDDNFTDGLRRLVRAQPGTALTARVSCLAWPPQVNQFENWLPPLGLEDGAAGLSQPADPAERATPTPRPLFLASACPHKHGVNVRIAFVKKPLTDVLVGGRACQRCTGVHRHKAGVSIKSDWSCAGFSESPRCHAHAFCSAARRLPMRARRDDACAGPGV